MLTQERESLIDEIIDSFSFEKVHIAMQALDWKWADQTGHLEVPGIKKLKTSARRLLRSACIDGGSHYCASGGLEAKYWPSVDGEGEGFSLRFILTEAASDD